MNKRKNSIIAASILASALITATPFALANHHGEEYRGDHHGKHNMEQMCEDFREGTGRFDREERHAQMEARRAEMAERLKLNDEQREIWDEIHEEQREKYQNRMKKWSEKLEKRCDNLKQ